MSSLEYGNIEGYSTKGGDLYHYSQFVHLPNGVVKVSGQGGWTKDFVTDANDWKGQIDNAFDNVENALKSAGLSGWDDVYLWRSYLIDMENHFPYLVETLKKRVPHRPVWTALSVPRLGGKDMLIEIEVEAYKK